MKNKTALITGASSGIGKEFAKLHAARGGDLVIVARSKDKLNELKKDLENKYNIKVMVIVKDLSLSNAAQEIYDEVKAANITIDYLINNAGFGGRGEFHVRSMEQDIQMIQVNVMTLTRLTKLFLSDFVKRGDGKILNVSSTAATMPGPLQAVYYATKAYVTSFSNAIWQEIKGTGVTITTLMPGAMDTGFAKASDMVNTPLFSKTVSPVNVAKDGYEGMLKGKLNVISGVTPIQRAFLAFTPLTPRKIMMKQIYEMQKEKRTK